MPEVLVFFSFLRPLWLMLRTTNANECWFVEVRRRAHSMVCFANIAGIDRIIYAICNAYIERREWRTRTHPLLHKLFNSTSSKFWFVVWADLWNNKARKCREAQHETANCIVVHCRFPRRRLLGNLLLHDPTSGDDFR